MRFASACLMLSLIAHPAFAGDRCESLAPTNAQDVTEGFKGKVEGEIKGILSRLAGGAASAEGQYGRYVIDELRLYPKADKLYVWQRVIYLACLSPELNIDLNKLLYSYFQEEHQITSMQRPKTREKQGVQSDIKGNNNSVTSIIGGSNNHINNDIGRQ